MKIHVHIHFDRQDDKLDKILEAIEKWHEAELIDLLKKLRAIRKDIKSTPINFKP